MTLREAQVGVGLVVRRDQLRSIIAADFERQHQQWKAEREALRRGERPAQPGHIEAAIAATQADKAARARWDVMQIDHHLSGLGIALEIE